MSIVSLFLHQISGGRLVVFVVRVVVSHFYKNIRLFSSNGVLVDLRYDLEVMPQCTAERIFPWYSVRVRLVDTEVVVSFSFVRSFALRWLVIFLQTLYHLIKLGGALGVFALRCSGSSKEARASLGYVTATTFVRLLNLKNLNLNCLFRFGKWRIWHLHFPVKR